jgi:hypothetical protein
MENIASEIAVVILKRRLGEGGQVEIPSLGITLSWRPDGWPLCPHCGEDELYSLFRWNGEGEKPPVEEWIKFGLRCYRCHWSSEP